MKQPDLPGSSSVMCCVSAACVRPRISSPAVSLIQGPRWCTPRLLLRRLLEQFLEVRDDKRGLLFDSLIFPAL